MNIPVTFEENDVSTIVTFEEDDVSTNVTFGETQVISGGGGGEILDQYTYNITENGTTTLATAGKYCDRNIDVNVDVPSYETELEEQKAITHSILSRSITEYEDNEVTFLSLWAFAYCRSLTKIRCDAVERLANYSLRECIALTEARFDGLTSTIGTYVFQNCTALEKVILGSSIFCPLSNVNTFTGTPIVNGTGYVYVQDNLVETYKTATNWSTYADQIKPISELEE